MDRPHSTHLSHYAWVKYADWLEGENAKLRKKSQALVDAQTDRWAAQTDHACVAANALVVATHNELTIALEPASSTVTGKLHR
jgi:hypothetical protein